MNEREEERGNKMKVQNNVSFDKYYLTFQIEEIIT
jgi:hypothetical protein